MLTVVFLLMQLMNVWVHPIHISVSEVELTADEITWTARIYRDDLLLALYGKNVDVSQLDDDDKIRKDILKYLTKNVSITIHASPLKWILTDLQPDPEAIWITLSAFLPDKPIDTLSVRNHILLDTYRDQKNVTNFIWATGKKNVVFDSGCDQKVISL